MQRISVAGADIPAIGLGTWPMKGEECREAVETALDLGYRHLDSAQMYGNEAAVGDAIDASTVDREEIFLVTKVRRGHLQRDSLLETTGESRDRLGTTIDMLLIHSPSRSVPVAESIGAMNDLQAEGVVDHIGVSNFSVEQLQEAMDASSTPIVTNQVEYHPLKSQATLLDFCVENEVMVTAYSPLAKGRVIGNETLEEIGKPYGKTGAQVALRWLIQQPFVSAIPKASSRRHQGDNIDIFDFELSDDEMARIFDLQGGLVTRLRNTLGL